MRKGLDIFRLLVAVGALIVMAAIGAPLFLIVLLGTCLYEAWCWGRGWLRGTRPAPAWDAEGGSPELPWPPPEPDHVRRQREAYAVRRELPPWAGASAREFDEAKKVAVRG